MKDIVPPSKALIDLQTYKRRDLFNVFSQYENPQISATVEVDLSMLKHACKRHNLHFFSSLVYCLSKTMNQILEFKHRVIDGQLYEFSRTDPGFTVSLPDNTFNFCDSTHIDNFEQFLAKIAQDIELAKKQNNQAIKDKHHMFFISNIPWFSFTQFQQPYFSHYGYNPVITIGRNMAKLEPDFVLPIALQCNHATVDGFHMGRFFQLLNTNIEVLANTFNAPHASKNASQLVNWRERIFLNHK